MFLLKSARFILLNNGPRHYALSRNLATQTKKAKPTSITQELLKKITMDAHVNIISEIPVAVHSCNVLDHPEGTTLHAKLFSDPSAEKRKTMLKPIKLTKRQKAMGCKVENDPAKKNVPCMQVCISPDKKNVDIILNKSECAENAHCEIDVPAFADLHVDAYDEVKVSRLQCRDIIVQSTSNIITNEIRCQKEVILHSTKGTIRCDSLIMGSLIDLKTSKDKGIFLDVATGGELRVKTTDGDITTNCVYAVNSLFETKNGHMRLKNVHKNTEIYITEKGFLQMVGTRAQFLICSGDGGLNLQLAYALGNSRITCNKATAKICIADKIAKGVDLIINSKEIILDNALRGLKKYINEDRAKLEHKVVDKMNKDSLTIEAKGQVELCELMWIDKLISDIKAKVNQNSDQKIAKK